MRCRILIMIMGLWVCVTMLGVAQTTTPLYINFFTHNEDLDYCTGKTSDVHCYFPASAPNAKTCGYQELEVFTKLRALGKELADTIRIKKAKWNWQSDWAFLDGIRRYDKGEPSTNNKNFARWLVEDNDGRIEADAHAHQTTYNYADVYYLLDSLGAKPSKVVGGFTWNYTMGERKLLNQPGYDWTVFTKTGLQGWQYPNFTWKPEVLWGGAGFNRRTMKTDHNSDVSTIGIWRPTDTSQVGFFTHKNSNPIILLGNGYGGPTDTTTTAESVVEKIVLVLDSIKSGKIPAGKFYAWSIDMHQKYWACAGFVQKVAKIIDLLQPYEKEGRIIWATHSEKVSMWKTTYKEIPSTHPYLVTSVQTPTFFQNDVAIFPNPLQPESHIRFRTDKKGFCSVRLYSLLGEEIVTLSQGEFQAGEHSVSLNAQRQVFQNLAQQALVIRVTTPGGVVFSLVQVQR